MRPSNTVPAAPCIVPIQEKSESPSGKALTPGSALLMRSISSDCSRLLTAWLSTVAVSRLLLFFRDPGLPSETVCVLISANAALLRARHRTAAGIEGSSALSKQNR